MTESPADFQDASRRTRLANERTLLAWWRSGLTAIAVAFATGKLVPALAGGNGHWAYTALGVGYGVIGGVCVAYGSRRFDQVERALAVGSFASPSRRWVNGLTFALIGLALATVVVVIADA